MERKIKSIRLNISLSFKINVQQVTRDNTSPTCEVTFDDNSTQTFLLHWKNCLCVNVPDDEKTEVMEQVNKFISVNYYEMCLKLKEELIRF